MWFYGMGGAWGSRDKSIKVGESAIERQPLDVSPWVGFRIMRRCGLIDQIVACSTSQDGTTVPAHDDHGKPSEEVLRVS